MAPYRLIDIDLARPIVPVRLDPDEDGAGVTWRWNGRLIGFDMVEAEKGAVLDAGSLSDLADERVGIRVLGSRVADAMEARWGLGRPDRPVPSLSVVICTKDRPERLDRLLGTLEPFVRDPAPFASVQVVVVDNNSVDGRTREAALKRPGFSYVMEPKTGLDFARNAGLDAATGDLIAYLDDDVVVDPGWLDGLFEAWRADPDAGGWTGLVLPFELTTQAQVDFERRGGFRRGFDKLAFGPEQHANVLHPVNAGSFGAGCNMAFHRKLLLDLDGFDEALDTGAPLPGGGDLDIFYRVIRAGRRLAYEPRYAVRHQHRQTVKQLERQYWTWGLGFMAFLEKSTRADPDMRPRHRSMVRWWFGDKVLALLWAARRADRKEVAFVFAELWGGIVGLFGEYDRSRRRTRRIREEAAA
jgi:glycosyltransferase involved in cell wall biosynthesis